MNCDRARPLIPLYLDGELTETQSATLRPHLLDCPGCRGTVQEEKTVRAWFLPTEPIAVPDGFAARVTRRSLAGDLGGRYEAAAPAEPQSGLYGFVLQAVAVAAVLLITLSIAIGRLELGSDRNLQADTSSLEDSLRALNNLNHAGETTVVDSGQEQEPRAEKVGSEE